MEKAAPFAAAAGEQLNLFGQPVVQIGSPPSYLVDVEVVDTPEKLTALSQRLAAAEQIAVDTETTSTDPMLAELVGISLAVEPGKGYYIPVGHRTGEPQLPLETVIEALRPALSDPRIPKVGTT